MFAQVTKLSVNQCWTCILAAAHWYQDTIITITISNNLLGWYDNCHTNHILTWDRYLILKNIVQDERFNPKFVTKFLFG
jgi:hypothetical protein